MGNDRNLGTHERWARFRFSVVGSLFAAPPENGDLSSEIAELSRRTWTHPITKKPRRFSYSTIERWYYQAKRGEDPVGVLRRKIRIDSGKTKVFGEPLKAAILAQHKDHKGWSYQLHYDNLGALVEKNTELTPLPSYWTVLRFMKANGLFKRRRLSSRDTAGAVRAENRLENLEVRSFEVVNVNGLWHLDFHHCSRKVLTPDGELAAPIMLGVLDDRSRLGCHAQWYFSETAEDLIHGLCQAFGKRGLPRALMTDNGSAMLAGETKEGLESLGIVHQPTLDYSPYQNGKQEVFWAQVEGRLIAMLEGVKDLTLQSLNEATMAWLEMEYNRKIHSEIGESPLSRFLSGPDVGRECPSSEALRIAFCMQESRAQRRSDGTITINGRRFEVPSRYGHFQRVHVRYARWDLSLVNMVDPKTGTVLCRIFPQDKASNADRRRARRGPGPLDGIAAEGPRAEQGDGVAPLLRKLMADYAATGLPPAYIPKPAAYETDDRKERR